MTAPRTVADVLKGMRRGEQVDLRVICANDGVFVISVETPLPDARQQHPAAVGPSIPHALETLLSKEV